MKKSTCFCPRPCKDGRAKPMRKQAVVKKAVKKKAVKKAVKKVEKRPALARYRARKKNNPLSESKMTKLLEHSKQHIGGMRSNHMKIMVKEMKRGETFSKSHSIAMKA